MPIISANREIEIGGLRFKSGPHKKITRPYLKKSQARCVLSYPGGSRRINVQSWALGKSVRPYQNQIKANRAVVSQVVEGEALSSNPSTTKKKQNKKKGKNTVAETQGPQLVQTSLSDPRICLRRPGALRF
jgi:hypothetical protein